MKLRWNPLAKGHGACEPFQDRLLARAGSAAPDLESSWEPDLRRHLDGCVACRELAEGLAMTSHVHPHWKSAMPPNGLALRTIEFLEPHWKRTERPVNREEIRLLWTGALGMAGATAALLLLVFDQSHPAGQLIATEGLIRIGARLTLLQFAGGILVSVVLLAIRAARSTESDHRPRDRNRGGSE